MQSPQIFLRLCGPTRLEPPSVVVIVKDLTFDDKNKDLRLEDKDKDLWFVDKDKDKDLRSEDKNKDL